MSSFRVASRYAKSLLELSIEKGILEKVKEDMDRVIALDNSSNEFSVLVKSPIVNSDKKLRILKSLFKEKVSSLTLTFFELVSKKGRESHLVAMAREFHKQYNDYLGIQRAEITSTIHLDENLRNSFKSIVNEISGKDKVELIENIDPNLIGGFVLRVEDRQLDESIKSKLQKLRLDFTQNLYEKKY
ncbi:MAG: ATP synthase F1 subunit delta [Cyclobacteriaceae bacterium]